MYVGSKESYHSMVLPSAATVGTLGLIVGKIVSKSASNIALAALVGAAWGAIAAYKKSVDFEDSPFSRSCNSTFNRGSLPKGFKPSRGVWILEVDDSTQSGAMGPAVQTWMSFFKEFIPMLFGRNGFGLDMDTGLFD